MCDHCDGKLLLLIGEIKGTVTEIKTQQAELKKEVGKTRDAVQKEIKDLSIDITRVKLKVFGGAAILGTIAGFLSRFIPS